MPLVDYREDPTSYANYFSSLNACITGTDFPAFREIPKLIKKHVFGAVTLDYGCGAGKSTLYLKSLGLKVDGVDINETMLNHATAADPEGDYKLIKSARTPVEDEHYDLVFSSWVFMEISSKQQMLEIAREITRVLKPNGTFITVLRNKDAYNNKWFSIDTQFEENKNLESGSVVKIRFKENNLSIYDYFWTDEDYREVMSMAGLSIIQTVNPLGRDDDGYAWVSEKEKSASTTYVAKKLH